MQIADHRYTSIGPYMVSTHWKEDTVGSTFPRLDDAVTYYWVGDHHPADDSTFERRWLIDARGQAIIWLEPGNADPAHRLACTDEAIVAMERVFPHADTSEVRMYCWQRQVVIGATNG